MENGETGLAGVTVTLTGTNDLGDTISLSTTTAANGSYAFDGLRPGTYAVAATTPTGYLTGKATPGTDGGTVDEGQITSVALSPGLWASANDFGELLPGVAGGLRLPRRERQWRHERRGNGPVGCERDAHRHRRQRQSRRRVDHHRSQRCLCFQRSAARGLLAARHDAERIHQHGRRGGNAGRHGGDDVRHERDRRRGQHGGELRLRRVGAGGRLRFRL